MQVAIDVIMPTSKERVANAIRQVKAALWQDIEYWMGGGVRVTVACAGSFPSLMDSLSAQEHEHVRIVPDAPQGVGGHAGVQHCLENTSLPWADWFYVMGDDDILLPWGLKHLYDNRHGVDMVIGQATTVHKVSHIATPITYGHTLVRGQVSGSCCLFNTKTLMSMEKPWWPSDTYAADWFVISKMLQHPARIIPNTVYCLAI